MIMCLGELFSTIVKFECIPFCLSSVLFVCLFVPFPPFTPTLPSPFHNLLPILPLIPHFTLSTPQLQYQRAHVLVALDHYEDAVEALDLVLTLAPKEPPVYSLLGTTLHYTAIHYTALHCTGFVYLHLAHGALTDGS